MTEKIAFEVVNSTPKIKKKSSILCDNNKVKICIFMIQNLVRKTIITNNHFHEILLWYLST